MTYKFKYLDNLAIYLMTINKISFKEYNSRIHKVERKEFKNKDLCKKFLFALFDSFDYFDRQHFMNYLVQTKSIDKNSKTNLLVDGIRPCLDSEDYIQLFSKLVIVKKWSEFSVNTLCEALGDDKVTNVIQSLYDLKGA